MIWRRGARERPPDCQVGTNTWRARTLVEVASAHIFQDSHFSFGHLIGTICEAFLFDAALPVHTKLQISLSWRQVVLRNV
jgi:hypothetical protein